MICLFPEYLFVITNTCISISLKFYVLYFYFQNIFFVIQNSNRARQSAQKTEQEGRIHLMKYKYINIKYYVPLCLKFDIFIFKTFFVIKTETWHGSTENTHIESKKVKLITEMIKICVFTLFFCYIAGKHFLIKTEGKVLDWPRATCYRRSLHGLVSPLSEVLHMDSRHASHSYID